MKQREIKFRAWNKKKKVFGFFEFKNYMLSGEEGYERGEVDPYINTWRWQKGSYGDYGDYFSFQINNNEIEDYNFQQYTGLKDKNGKEIYEGDIIKCGAHINIMDEDVCRMDFDWWNDIQDKEVIGNIYENKELII